MKVIKGFTSNGLKYIDESGIDKFVNFKECNENWIRYRKRSETLDDEKFESVRLNDRCVGQRDICARPYFIEFFTRPFTRFEFDEEEAFKQLKSNIISAGWSTYDLS